MIGELFAECGYRWRNSRLGRLKLRPGLPKAPLTSLDAHRAILSATTTARGDARVPVVHLTDVGVASWFYLTALLEAFPEARIVGMEIDPNRRLMDFFRRGDHARAQTHVARAEGRDVEFYSGDYREWSGAPQASASCVRLTTFFFPFVFDGTARAWGLPGRFAAWPELLKKASVESELILVSHLTQEEAQATDQACAGMGLCAPRWARVSVPTWAQDPLWVTQITGVSEGIKSETPCIKSF